MGVRMFRAKRQMHILALAVGTFMLTTPGFAFDRAAVEARCKNEWPGLPPLISSCVDDLRQSWGRLEEARLRAGHRYGQEIADRCGSLPSIQYAAIADCIEDVVEGEESLVSERARAMAWPKPHSMPQDEFEKNKAACISLTGKMYHTFEYCMNGLTLDTASEER